MLSVRKCRYDQAEQSPRCIWHLNHFSVRSGTPAYQRSIPVSLLLPNFGMIDITSSIKGRVLTRERMQSKNVSGHDALRYTFMKVKA